MVENLCNGLIPCASTDTKLEDAADYRSSGLVDLKHGLRDSRGALLGHRVRRALRPVPVQRLPDVEARLGVDFTTAPGLLQQVQDIPLADSLLDPPGEYGGGVLELAPRGDDRFVGGERRNSEFLEFVFDAG
ncbi:hypothetical protein [Glycomyces sp. NRRL B-16210]|uniref:hypothetical protein n=1 Tax=Glycomyces sp. NRRL B-16210 TaxID=1463821 RepID=UPI0014150D71|nr:hypothetical protein [Glycomyces sp. NRRL B-16210]